MKRIVIGDCDGGLGRGCRAVGPGDLLRDGTLDERAVNLGTAVLPNGCGMLVRALGTTASQVHGALLKIWGVLKG